jgi:hypothetical protein
MGICPLTHAEPRLPTLALRISTQSPPSVGRPDIFPCGQSCRARRRFLPDSLRSSSNDFASISWSLVGGSKMAVFRHRKCACPRRLPYRGDVRPKRPHMLPAVLLRQRQGDMAAADRCCNNRSRGSFAEDVCGGVRHDRFFSRGTFRCPSWAVSWAFCS